MKTRALKNTSCVLLPVMALYAFAPSYFASAVDCETLAINSGFSLTENPFKYSSYYRDSESGVYYLKARYYSPKLARFISRDTYDLSNRYAYCDGNPISKIDPNGHDGLSVDLALVAFLAVGVATLFMGVVSALTVKEIVENLIGVEHSIRRKGIVYEGLSQIVFTGLNLAGAVRQLDSLQQQDFITKAIGAKDEVDPRTNVMVNILSVITILGCFIVPLGGYLNFLSVKSKATGLLFAKTAGLGSFAGSICAITSPFASEMEYNALTPGSTPSSQPSLGFASGAVGLGAKNEMIKRLARD